MKGCKLFVFLLFITTNSLYAQLNHSVFLVGNIAGRTPDAKVQSALKHEIEKAGAATNIRNDYEFYQANTLGGPTNLRGYPRTRFAGKTSFYQNTKLRLK